MTKPLLHLLHHETLDPTARATVIEELLYQHPETLLCGAADEEWLHRIVIATAVDGDMQLQALTNNLKRYPALATLQLDIHRTQPQDKPLAGEQLVSATPSHLNLDRALLKEGLANADLLVEMQTAAQHVVPVLEAMAAGVPVLVSDLSDAKFVLDGINGFLYRANDADSLALSLLTLRRLPRDIVQRIVQQARQTLATVFDPRDIATLHAEGERL